MWRGLPRGVYGGGGEEGGWGEGGGMGLHRWRGTCSGGDFVGDDIITALLLGTIGKSQLPAVGNKGISIMELEKLMVSIHSMTLYAFINSFGGGPVQIDQ